MNNKAANLLKIPEIVERIVENLGDEDLFMISKLGDMWYKVARREAYERWKIYANQFKNTYRETQAIKEKFQKGEINWLEADCKIECLYNWMDIETEMQLNIMENMLENEMIVDPQEEETIRKVIIERNWGGKWSRNPIGIQLTIRMGME